MERKTNSVALPSGATVELKEYISAGEFLDVSDAKDGEISKTELAQRLVRIAVVSLNGSAENLPTALRDLSLPDYIFLSKEVAKLTSPDFMEAKNQ